MSDFLGEDMSIQKRFPFAHTFSIVARDPNTGQMGVAVQSHWFSVGSLVTWGRAGVGVIATQAMVEVSYGPLGLGLMAEGKTASEALTCLKEKDSGKAIRQVAMIDVQGNVAVHTGERCIQSAGHKAGENYSVQANMMDNESVWPAMAEAFEKSSGTLSERLLVALEAAQFAGGDVRGKQSAAMLIVDGNKKEMEWEGVLLDLRVEDHPEPIQELRRLVTLHNAYELMNEGDACLGAGKTNEALMKYEKAASLAPQILELPFWHAVTMAEIGKVDEALPIFHQIFEADLQWKKLLQRLPEAGLFNVDRSVLDRILQLV
ncbi:MAG: Zn-dependent protease [Anaerolineaceae bacterium]|nr:Zn-dependent protease [Anaerolineaceae bacterium]